MIQSTRLAAALLMVAAALAPGASGAAQTGATAAPDKALLERGKAVYNEWCAACHDPGPRHPGTQALDALYRGKKPGALEQRTDLVPTLTETFVRRGVSVMPPFRKTEISDADLAALAAYLAPRP
ncbi:MAG TPA: cytochrome c [Vicinamibacterales bacterium]|nr:cytochrome c [Vicinamibacterales bacterium]